MYPEYFGLKEASFSITPDPHYLYLSQRHREALAHLLYGAGEGGGFVLLTGEVGTGKTTICRTFLEQLPDHVDVALILNPAVSVPELLHGVCGEFGVTVPAGETSTKRLVDRLNAYLLETHAKGRRPVLMIDEAQNLQPDVLEQIRLLTNLETHKHKLLQIFLVGQPELRELLQQRNLRQLSQRITARYHLTPLNPKETAEYIRHRLAVAGVERPLFTPAAMRRIFRLSGGVPRLINILCDRSLLGAFATQARQVDRRIVSRAHRELQGRPHGIDGRQWRRPLVWSTLTLFLCAGLGWLAYGWMQEHLTDSHLATAAAPLPAQPPSVEAAMAPATESTAPTQAGEITREEAAPQPPPDLTPEPEVQPSLADFLRDESQAFTLLLQQWGADPLPDSADPCVFAESHSLRCRRGNAGWERLEFYDRPALIKLSDISGRSGYLLATHLDPQSVTLATGEGQSPIPRRLLTDHWNGDFLFLWRPAPGNRSLIDTEAPADAILWLKQALGRVPGLAPEQLDSPQFDAALTQTITSFQRERGLEADGIAGPETLIQLNTAAGGADIPRLQTEH